MNSSLDALKASGTLVVADSGDLKKLAATGAIDATTNVSLRRGEVTCILSLRL